MYPCGLSTVHVSGHVCVGVGINNSASGPTKAPSGIRQATVDNLIADIRRALLYIYIYIYISRGQLPHDHTEARKGIEWN